VLVGRERESAQLAGLLENARHGSAASVVVWQEVVLEDFETTQYSNKDITLKVSISLRLASICLRNFVH